MRQFMIFVRWFAMGILITLATNSAVGQVAGATLSGTVTDSSGAVLPKAELAIADVSTGIVRTVNSDTSGLYTAPNLLPGTYSITASAAGFATQVRSNVVLTVGAQLEINFAMKVGSSTERVNVEAETPGVQLASSSISAVVDQNTVRELPLNGRDWTQLATLQPGVVSMASAQPAVAGFARGNRGYGAQLTISGGRPQQNNYRIDGVTVNDYVNSGPGSVLGVTLGVDAIQEFSVLTMNYSAEYGRTSGGVVNAITRSGTNKFHGNAYEFIRNSALDARNYFDGPNIPPFKRNQFGGSIGGPVIKDRTFFFVDYEGLRQSLGITSVDTVPSLDLRNGIIHNTNGTTTTVTVNPNVQPFLALWHVPNGALLGTGNTGLYSVAIQQITNENFLATRGDHKFSDKDSIAASYQYDTAPSTQPDALNDISGGFKTIRHSTSLEETHIFSPQFIDTIRIGYNRVVADNDDGLSAINPAAGTTALGTVPGRDAPLISVPGLTQFSGGENAITTSRYRWNSFQGYDDAFVTKGKHSLKFGAAGERIQDNLEQLGAPGGQFKFGSLTAFLTDQPTTLTAQLPGTLSERGLRQTIFGTYLQDDWRLKPTLTLNLGMRYEMSTVPTEVNGKLSTLRNITDSQPHLGDPLFANPTLRNFEPRIGFAWDPFGTGKTSVRGGFGIFDVLPLVYEYGIIEISPPPFAIVATATSLPAGSFPTGAYSLLQVPSALRNTYIQPNPKRNYVMQWNYNMQRELAPNLTATIAYVGSRGVHQPFRADDIDTVLPTLTPAGYLWPSPAGSGTRLNTNVGRIDALIWDSNSAYNGLETQVVKKMAHGFQLQGSYTWSKSIDDGSGSTHGDPFANSISSEFFFDAKIRRGLSDFNIKHNAVINYIWEIPGVHSGNVLGWAASGWQAGGVFEVQSGLPFTPLLGGDPLGLKSNFPYDFPNHNFTAGCGSGVNPGQIQYINMQCFSFPNPSTLLGNTSRNSIIGPGLTDLDFSLFKNNRIPRISEQFNVQFRAEVFNILNHANFQAPIDNETLFDQNGVPVPGAGRIDRTTTTARQLQFAVKISF